jgi:hypothetical protein
MAKDHIRREGTVLPQRLCDYCGEYVERKCRNRAKCPNVKTEIAPTKIPFWFWGAVVVISITAALLLAGR